MDVFNNFEIAAEIVSEKKKTSSIALLTVFLKEPGPFRAHHSVVGVIILRAQFTLESLSQFLKFSTHEMEKLKWHSFNVKRM